MKIIQISAAAMLFGAAFACQPSPRGNDDETTEPLREERIDEPQVRDGIAESEMRDSLAIDTASGDTTSDSGL